MRTLLLGTVLLVLFGHAQVPGNSEQPSVVQERSGNTFEVFVNNPLYAPITIRFDISSTNMQLSEGNSFEAIIPARSRTSVFTAAPANTQAAWNFNFRQRWVLGDITAEHDNRVIYDLPFAQSQRYRIMQGYGGRFSHFGEFQYSLDFDMPVDTPVHASRDGVVVRVETSFTQGGPNPALRDKANVVTVLHDDNTLADYVHLRPGGSLVKVGQMVRRGDPLGYSGNTGYTSAPHLHFHVYKPLDTTGKWAALRVVYRALEGEGVEPIEGQSYTRP